MLPPWATVGRKSMSTAGGKSVSFNRIFEGAPYIVENVSTSS